MDRYRAFINRQALQALSVPCQIPDCHLMVGFAEELSSQPIILYRDYMPKQKAVMLPDVSEMSYEEIQQNLASGTLTINDFFQNVYPLGEPIVKE